MEIRRRSLKSREVKNRSLVRIISPARTKFRKSRIRILISGSNSVRKDKKASISGTSSKSPEEKTTLLVEVLILALTPTGVPVTVSKMTR